MKKIDTEYLKTLMLKDIAIAITSIVDSCNELIDEVNRLDRELVGFKTGGHSQKNSMEIADLSDVGFKNTYKPKRQKYQGIPKTKSNTRESLVISAPKSTSSCCGADVSITKFGTICTVCNEFCDLEPGQVYTIPNDPDSPYNAYLLHE